MSSGENHVIYRLAKVLRFLLAPLVLFALAALILAHNSRADLVITGVGRQSPPSTGNPEPDRGATDEEYESDPALPTAPPAKDWDEVIDQQGGDQVRFGVKIGGLLPFDRASQEAFVPASITKLFTAGAALEILGPDYRFESPVRWRATAQPGQITELTIVGSGDPTWDPATFGRIARSLAQAGVKEVSGAIRFESLDPRWDSVEVPPGWNPKDLVTCDGALPHAFNIALNCAILVVNASEAHWSDRTVPTPVRTSIVAGEQTSIHVRRERDGYVVEGTWARGLKARMLALPVPDTAAWASRLMEAALKTARIEIVAESVDAPVSLGEGYSLKFRSDRLRDILKPFLKSSVNLIGEDLWIAMGGHEAVAAFIVKSVAQSADASVSIEDGCGMSHSNRVSPAAVYSLLETLSRSNTFAILWDALPIAGVDGTLGTRMRGTAAQGVLRAKTGTLSGAHNLAGYVPRYNAVGISVAYVPFVTLGQTTRKLRFVAIASQNRVGVRLSRVVNQ